MKYMEEYRNFALVKALAGEIEKEAKKLGNKTLQLMEVCGTHTMAIGKFGIRTMLPDNIRLLSGPGCPVCVTPDTYIDKAAAFSRMPETIIATFGDMIKVPGSFSSLEKEKSGGGKIEVVYSPLESLEIAEANPAFNAIFLGLGFETTAPAVALTIKKAAENKMKNFYVLSGHKLIPPAMEVLLQDKQVRIDGFICPGHVSAITGSRPYDFIPESYKIPCVIAGFEPADILESILMLVRKIAGREKPSVEIQYKRIVKKEGNKKALKIMKEVFRTVDSEWRGIGVIKNSGLALAGRYGRFDAESRFPVIVKKSKKKTACICGDILKGKKEPHECALFGKLCTPENPVGPCMVSSEGTCAAFYRYGEQ
ncbi:MAG: hydrogenase formation protein HypD [Candidatus Omnitrophica bacterium]|nr:hydrogenase formation protein HypD [Candidatus Omnitrophota bacterium]